MVALRKTLRGIRLKHLKHAAEKQTVSMPMPKQVIIPMQQHIGAPCEPTVKVGSKVKAGEKIGESSAFVSAPIYASIAGEVTQISEIQLFQASVKAVTITAGEGENDGLYEAVSAPKVNDRKTFLAAVRESGLVGLGGAGFPTHVKLSYKDMEHVHTLVINGAECEPYITSDYRECIENTSDIIQGICLVLQYTGIPKAVIAVESNKPKAINVLNDEIRRRCEMGGTGKDTDAENKTGVFAKHISVKQLKSLYPKGAEKVAIFEATGVIVKEGTLPADNGVIVLNVTTVAAIAKYIQTGMPLISKRITIDGDIVDNPQNVIAAIGTPVKDLMRYANIKKEKCNMMIAGGMMMGVCLPGDDMPVMKNTNAVLFFHDVYNKGQSNCIQCSRCIAVCPLNLMPGALEKALDSRDKEALKKYNVDLCMNCGCCSYACPAKRDLSHKNQLGKLFLKESLGK